MSSPGSPVEGMKNAALIFVIVVGLGLLYPLQRWIDKEAPREVVSDETLYLSGKTVKKMSLGLEGLAADIYWIRTVQYFGRKILDSERPGAPIASQGVRMDLLAPLLDIIVTLDPHHTPAYRFGAIFLPELDMRAAVALLEKGIRDNPDDWRMYQDIGYIYWQAGKRATEEERASYYAKAAEWYEKGSEIPGALWWMRDLAGVMKIKGENRAVARAIYSAYVTSDDENIRSQAVARLKQLRALDEIDFIHAQIARYKEQTGKCPDTLALFAPQLHSVQINLREDSWPLDPDGFAYYYDQATCKVRLAYDSTVPQI
jgi:tetratricopeptide (TPR) repeat protein